MWIVLLTNTRGQRDHIITYQSENIKVEFVAGQARPRDVPGYYPKWMTIYQEHGEVLLYRRFLWADWRPSEIPEQSNPVVSKESNFFPNYTPVGSWMVGTFLV